MKGLDKPFVAREENEFFGKGKLKGVDAERKRCWKEEMLIGIDAGKGMVLRGKQS